MAGSLDRAPLSLNGWLRYDLVRRLLATIPDSRTLVEIGAGMGAMGLRLAEGRNYLGVEPDEASYEVAHRRIAMTGRGVLLHGDATIIPPATVADVVCAFEVLEHIEDDQAALELWGSFLRPGGTLLISVPAWQRRFGPSDARVGHFRRYDRDQLATLLSRAGYRDARILIYGFPLGFVLEAAWDVVARRQQGANSIGERAAESGRWIQPPAWTGLATQVATLPFRIAQRPFVHTNLGMGLVALAHKGAGEG
jgi:SAM-dependent methyltransferase